MAAPQTPVHRYPDALSKSGPSRRPSRIQYPSPSIDDEIPTPVVEPSTIITPLSNSQYTYPQQLPRHLQQHQQQPHHPYPEYSFAPQAYHGGPILPISGRAEYSSLQHLLEEAGYKETRVFTPPAEKSGRRIKKTFDEIDAADVSELYSAYGLREHRIQNITEPSLPLKSSSSLLRSLALQESSAHNHNESPQPGTSPSSYDSWWGGGIAALGRAAKAVMDMSPPGKDVTPFEDNSKLNHSVGLGLAKGGEGVRRVKSNWELHRESPPQEEVPPMPIAAPQARLQQPVQQSTYSFASPPPPQTIDDDAFGYCPLPEDYEAQCEDDEMYAVGFDVDSLGDSSSPKSARSEASRAGSEEAEVMSIDACLAMVSGENEVMARMDSLDLMMSPDSSESVDVMGGAGRRVLASTVAYDELESPTKKPTPLPNRCEAQRPIASPSPTPSPERPSERVETVVVKKPSKYGDRATKLRMAKSTPILSRPAPEVSWYGSIRHALGYQNDAYQSIPVEPLPTSSVPAPIRLSPAMLAAPALVTASPIVCDSASTEAADLPAIPTTMSAAPQTSGVIGNIALRLRPSLAKLRSAIGVPPPPLPPLPAMTGDGTPPTLSPRLDWSAAGEQFAGWNRDSVRQSAPASSAQPFDGAETGGSIDYSKSFFYKPATPPHPHAASRSAADSASESAPPPSSPVARRQRSIKSLRAALLIPVAPPPPPVPPLPAQYASSTASRNSDGQSNKDSPLLRTPPLKATLRGTPPLLAILSPGAWEEGRPPRELVLEGEEWDARDGGVPGDWGQKGRKVKRRGSKKKQHRT